MLRGRTSVSKIRRDLTRLSATTVATTVRSSASECPAIIICSGRSNRVTANRRCRALPRQSKPMFQPMPIPGSFDGSMRATVAPRPISIRSSASKFPTTSNRRSAGRSVSIRVENFI